MSRNDNAPKIALHSLGCKVNQAEGEMLVARLIAQGARLVDIELADLVLLTTCTVTGEAEAKTKKSIRRLLAANRRSTVLAIGCDVAINTRYYQTLGERVRAESTPEKAYSQAIQILGLSGPETALVGFSAGYVHPDSQPISRQRYNLKVQDGCDSHCTYCIVRIARGPSRSIPLADVISAARQAELSGIREVVLTGVNLGSYSQPGGPGADSGSVGSSNTGPGNKGPGSTGPGSTDGSIVGMLERLLDETSLCRYRLSSIEPLDVSDSLVDLIASSAGRICAHLHMPMQSGSNKVLKAMNRPYTTESFRERVAYARKRLPGLALSTDVIVGFPGESDEDFSLTKRFALEMAFMRMHVFRYSAREGTAAASLPDQVAPEIKASRSAELRGLADRLTVEDITRKRLGRTEQVIVERTGRGRSESYHPVILEPACRPGSLVTVRFSGRRDKLLECTLELDERV